MAPLGALTQAWTAAEAALPLGWHVAGLSRFGDEWMAMAEGDSEWIDAWGPSPEQALRRLSDRLQERRGVQSGES
jgi:hypothetical protein